jgi:UDP-3-O-[3-hydroxymyristoyl] N-acetylglucosamine deacetylase
MLQATSCRREVQLFQSSESLEQSLQHTLKSSISCQGVGVHSGQQTQLFLHPAPANHGIVFVRTDIVHGDNKIPARWDHVGETRLCTVLGNAAGATVSTVEHLMAALRGCGIDNAQIDINGAEVPIMDGSAEPFVFLIECAGRIAQDAFRRSIRILKTIHVGDDQKFARLDPSDQARFSFTVDFPDRQHLNQAKETVLYNGAFKHDIARARTFGFFEEVEQLRAAGLARGGSLDNAIVIKGDAVLNNGGLRFDDELVRHKILDAIGDLYLAGAAIDGAYTGFRAGHAMNNQLLHALFSQPDAWEWAPPREIDMTSQSGWDHRLLSAR